MVTAKEGGSSFGIQVYWNDQGEGEDLECFAVGLKM